MAERDPIKTLEALEKSLDKKVAAILNDCTFRIKDRVDSQEFIHWKSRRKPIVVEKAKAVGTLLVATVRGASHWDWAPVLIGPPGSTTIKAKKAGGMLAIPTDAVSTFNKKAYTPAMYRGKGIEIFAGRIWQKVGWGGRGARAFVRQRRAAGESIDKEKLIPIFTLKGSIVVKRRVIPSELFAWIKPYFQEKIKEVLKIDATF